jgi:hypothetical protein
MGCRQMMSAAAAAFLGSGRGVAERDNPRRGFERAVGRAERHGPTCHSREPNSLPVATAGAWHRHLCGSLARAPSRGNATHGYAI